MALSLVQYKDGIDNAFTHTSFSITLTSTSTSGNAIMVAAVISTLGGASGITITNDKGDTFTPSSGGVYTDVPGSGQYLLGAFLTPSAGVSTVTVTTSNIAAFEVAVWEVTNGSAVTWSLDAYHVAAGSSATFDSGSSGTLAQAAEFAIGLANTAGGSSGGSGWTDDGDCGTGNLTQASHLITSATTAFDFTGPCTSGAWVAFILTLKAVAGGGGPTTFNQTVTVTCSATVTVKKAVAKKTAVTCASTVSLLKSIAKKLAVACATSVVVSATRAFLLTINVTCASTVTVKKAVGKQIAVACSGAVAVKKAVAKKLAPACSGAVSVIKSVNKKLSVTSATTVAVNATRAFLVTINVACTSAVTLKKSVGKKIAVACSGAVTLKKAVAHKVAVACTGAVSVTKGVAHKMSVACTTTVSVLTQLVSFVVRRKINLTIFRK